MQAADEDDDERAQERRLGAVDDPGPDVAAQLVRAQEVLAARLLERRREVLGVRVESRQEARDDRRDEDRHEHDEAGDRGPVPGERRAAHATQEPGPMDADRLDGHAYRIRGSMTA